MKITYHTLNPRQKGIDGWLCFWAKTVTGFDPKVHCQACLVGDRIWSVRREMLANVEIVEPFDEGTILYICGVAYPWNYDNNFHLIVRARKGRQASLKAWNGDRVTVADAEKIKIDAEPARRMFPDKGPKFLTCRNYQFGAQYVQRYPDKMAAALATEPQVNLDLR